MTEAILSMLKKYNLQNNDDYEHALKEILQEIALLGLWRSKFFEKAAFYGGSSLRILYGLDRFSEDLDFSLLSRDPRFNLSKYCNAVEEEIKSFGFTVTVERKVKTKLSTTQSAFIKADTLENMLTINVPDLLLKRFHKTSKLKIKFEVDIEPPLGFETEAKFLLQPIPFSVNTFKIEDIFAGKLHCVLYRQWQNRVKGRDWYDFVWFVGKNIPARLSHLEYRCKQSGHLMQHDHLDEKTLKNLLLKKIELTDFENAKLDVRYFLKDPDSIQVWSKDFFIDVVSKLKTQ